MAVLRVRDNAGNITEIVTIKGDKGDKGDPGTVTYGTLTPEQKNDLIAEGIRMCAEVAAGVTTIEQNHLKPLQFWVGTEDEYNALSEKKEGTFYIISDDTTYENLTMRLFELEKKLAQLEAHFATT